MKILHITSAKTWRGGERQIYLLLKGLNAKGIECFLMCPKDSAVSDRSKELVKNTIIFKNGFLSIIQNVKKLISFCRLHEIDMIHGHDSHSHSVLWLAYLYGGLDIKSVITRRIDNPVKRRSTKKYNHPKIEQIICISKAVFRTLSPSIENKERLTVIHSGVELKGIPNPLRTYSKGAAFTVGYVAAFTEEKDHHTFIKTAEYLQNKYPESAIDFVLIGDGPLKKEIEALSEKSKLPIRFTGFIENVHDWYLKMDLLLHPSQSEALGTSILDAMQYKLPVISTKIGGIPEIIEHKTNGFLYNPGDYVGMGEGIVHLINNPEEYSKIGEMNRLRVKEFGEDKMVMKTINLYNSLNRT